MRKLLCNNTKRNINKLFFLVDHKLIIPFVAESAFALGPTILVVGVEEVALDVGKSLPPIPHVAGTDADSLNSPPLQEVKGIF